MLAEVEEFDFTRFGYLRLSEYLQDIAIAPAGKSVGELAKQLV